MKIHKNFCIYCKEESINDECDDCKQIWLSYIPPDYCIYCNRLNEEFCAFCRHGYEDERDANEWAMAWWMQKHMKHVTDFHKLFNKPKKYVLKKREYFIKKYGICSTSFCNCKYYQRLDRIKGSKKAKQRQIADDNAFIKSIHH